MPFKLHSSSCRSVQLGMPRKTRLDELLVSKGIYDTKEEALRAVLAREVKVGDEYATSAAMLVASDVAVTAKEEKRYVSRGGLKLQGALDAFNQNVTELHCIDIGCSTGGFTDCLLQAGASSVVAVDVGYGDFAWKLRNDPRVTLFERTNIRLAAPEKLGAPFDLLVADLSFIGLASLALTFAALCKLDSVFIGLVKPQFESRQGETDERGVVRDEAVRARTVQEVESALVEAGFVVTGVIESPIKGKRSGNVEYLIRAVFAPQGTAL